MRKPWPAKRPRYRLGYPIKEKEDVKFKTKLKKQKIKEIIDKLEVPEVIEEVTIKPEKEIKKEDETKKPENRELKKEVVV